MKNNNTWKLKRTIFFHFLLLEQTFLLFLRETGAMWDNKEKKDGKEGSQYIQRERRKLKRKWGKKVEEQKVYHYPHGFVKAEFSKKKKKTVIELILKQWNFLIFYWREGKIHKKRTNFSDIDRGPNQVEFNYKRQTVNPQQKRMLRVVQKVKHPAGGKGQ